MKTLTDLVFPVLAGLALAALVAALVLALLGEVAFVDSASCRQPSAAPNTPLACG